MIDKAQSFVDHCVVSVHQSDSGGDRTIVMFGGYQRRPDFFHARTSFANADSIDLFLKS